MITLINTLPPDYEFISLHFAAEYKQRYHVCLRKKWPTGELYCYKVAIADTPELAAAEAVKLIDTALAGPVPGRDDWRSKPLVKGRNDHLSETRVVSFDGLDLLELKLDL